MKKYLCFLMVFALFLSFAYADSTIEYETFDFYEESNILYKPEQITQIPETNLQVCIQFMFDIVDIPDDEEHQNTIFMLRKPDDDPLDIVVDLIPIDSDADPMLTRLNELLELKDLYSEVKPLLLNGFPAIFYIYTDDKGIRFWTSECFIEDSCIKVYFKNDHTWSSFAIMTAASITPVE